MQLMCSLLENVYLPYAEFVHNFNVTEIDRRLQFFFVLLMHYYVYRNVKLKKVIIAYKFNFFGF